MQGFHCDESFQHFESFCIPLTMGYHKDNGHFRLHLIPRFQKERNKWNGKSLNQGSSLAGQWDRLKQRLVELWLLCIYFVWLWIECDRERNLNSLPWQAFCTFGLRYHRVKNVWKNEKKRMHQRLEWILHCSHLVR